MDIRKNDTFSKKLTALKTIYNKKGNIWDCIRKNTKIVLALSGVLGYTKRAVT